jgi:hypothetical protein
MAGTRLGNSRKNARASHTDLSSDKGLAACLPTGLDTNLVLRHYFLSTPRPLHVTVRHRAAWDRLHASNLKELPEQCWEELSRV